MNDESGLNKSVALVFRFRVVHLSERYSLFHLKTVLICQAKFLPLSPKICLYVFQNFEQNNSPYLVSIHSRKIVRRSSILCHEILHW